MAGWVLDLGRVPCCESHEQLLWAVRGTGKESGGDSEEGGQERHSHSLSWSVIR